MKSKHDNGKGASDGHLRVLVVDDSGLVRHRLCQVLNADGQLKVVGCAGNGRLAVSLAADLRPDVVLMDMRMPEMDGLEATRQIKMWPRAPLVLVVSLDDTPRNRAAARAVGADGFLSKDDALRRVAPLLGAMLQRRKGSKRPLAAANRSWLFGCGLQVQAAAGNERAEPNPMLTPRERQIALLIAEGHSSKEVAHQLQISVMTVGKHRSNLMRKLNLHSASELVRYAIRRGLVKP